MRPQPQNKEARLYDEAVGYVYAGRLRDSADAYAKCYEAAKNPSLVTWDVLVGYCSFFRLGQLELIDRDEAFLKKIVKSSSALTHHRMTAAFTLGKAAYEKGNRERASKYYRKTLELELLLIKDKKLLQEKELTNTGPKTVQWLVIDDPAGPARTAEMNLNVLRGGKSDYSNDSSTTKALPIMMGPVKNPVAVRGLLERLTLVETTAECYMCGKRNPKESRWKVCSKCRTARYCSSDCQKHDWSKERNSHKSMCRTGLCVGDLVRLHNFDAAPEMNGAIVEVVETGGDGIKIAIVGNDAKDGYLVKDEKQLTRVCFKEMRKDAF